MTYTHSIESSDKLKKSYVAFFKQKDDDSSFYFTQMIGLLYEELSYETDNKKVLYGIVCKNFKNNINMVFKNMKDYFLELSDDAIKGLNDIVNFSNMNKYVDINNLKRLCQNFLNKISYEMKIDNKINALVTMNGNALRQELNVEFNLEDNAKVSEIVKRYINVINKEMAKNANSKHNFILDSFDNVITQMLEEANTDKQVIIDKNINIINNSVKLYLKEQEYIIIDKYIDDNFRYIKESVDELDKVLSEKFNQKKNNKKSLNDLKNYLLGFNNTIGNKVKKIFNEMNDAISLEGNDLKNKMKQFNDLTSRVFETTLVFDKQFLIYKKEFSVSALNYDSFDKMYKQYTSRITEGIKVNISNIFRDNIKIYNDTIYKSLLIKSKVYDFNEILSVEKVKDLLLE